MDWTFWNDFVASVPSLLKTDLKNGRGNIEEKIEILNIENWNLKIEYWKNLKIFFPTSLFQFKGIHLVISTKLK